MQIKRFLTVLLLLGTFIATSLPANACDLCAVYSFVETQSGIEGSLNTGVAYRFTHYESNIRPNGNNALPGQHLDSNIWQLYGRYNISDSSAVQLNIPLIYRDYRRVSSDGRIENGTESGLGDLSFSFHYVPYKEFQENQSTRFELFGAIKLPTGDSDPLGEEKSAFVSNLARHSSIDGSLVGGDDLALGSGSTDFIIGAILFHQINNFYLQGNFQYAIRTEGDFDYEYGNDFQWDFGPAYYFLLDDKHTLSTRLRFSGEYKKEDQILGTKLVDSDESTIYLGAELNYSQGLRWFLNLGLDVPIDSERSTDQVTPKFRLLASLIYKFYL